MYSPIIVGGLNLNYGLKTPRGLKVYQLSVWLALAVGLAEAEAEALAEAGARAT